MHRLLIIVLMFVILGQPVAAQERYTGQTIEEILALPEARIDLGVACLILAKDAYPDINIAGFDALIDHMAQQLDRLIQGVTDPEARIAMMNTYLYKPGWWNDSLTFDYDLEDLEANRKENQFLNGYLSTRTGSCITMPMLHLVLADRLGWPMAAVRAPKHFFVRYVGHEKANVEATSYGGYLQDAYYKELTEIPDKAIGHGVYLRTLTKKEYIASLMVNNARHFDEREPDLKKAIRYMHIALSVDTTFVSAHWNLGHYYKSAAEILHTELQSNLAVAGKIFESDIRTLNQLTVVKPSVPAPRPEHANMVRPDKSGRDHIPDPLDAWPNLRIPPTPSITTPSHQISAIDAYVIQARQEYESEQRRLRDLYVPKIEELLMRANWHQQYAKDLGMVLMSPTRLYQRQEVMIERLKR